MKAPIVSMVGFIPPGLHHEVSQKVRNSEKPKLHMASSRVALLEASSRTREMRTGSADSGFKAIVGILEGVVAAIVIRIAILIGTMLAILVTILVTVEASAMLERPSSSFLPLLCPDLPSHHRHHPHDRHVFAL